MRVAILPAGNLTKQEGAPLIIDKAWEEGLRQAGFIVINADSAVTYLSSSGVPISKVSTIPTAKLGADLHADFLIEDQIDNWGTKYRVLAAGAVVSCRSTLIEASTGAVVWSSDWTMAESDNSGGNNGLAGVLANALVTAVADSMFDRPTQLARRGVAIQAGSQPYPGFAPAMGDPP